METFSKYIFSIVAVCIAVSMIRKLTSNHGSAALISGLCGVVLTITVISPIVKLKISDFSDYTNYIHSDADALVQAGKQQSDEQLRTIITDEVTAYILEKASMYDCCIDGVEVVLSDDAVPVPDTVRITGLYAPNTKKYLSDIIETNLGISKEKQQWTYRS